MKRTWCILAVAQSCGRPEFTLSSHARLLARDQALERKGASGAAAACRRDGSRCSDERTGRHNAIVGILQKLSSGVRECGAPYEATQRRYQDALGPATSAWRP